MVKNKLHPIVWHIPDKAKGNCYVFGLGPRAGLGGYSKRRLFKSVPGEKCTQRDKCCFSDIPFDFEDCEQLARRVVCDNPNSVVKLRKNVSLTKDLKPGYHMMCSMLSSDGQQDYHFARRFRIEDLDANDLKRYLTSLPEPANTELRAILANNRSTNHVWIHQRGWMSGGPVMHDASNRLITDIRKSNFNYGDLNYKKICSFFMVRTRKASVSVK